MVSIHQVNFPSSSPGFRRRRKRSRISAARPARLHQVIFAGKPPTGERAEHHFLRWCALRVRLELEMERTEREQERESWAGFQIRTAFPGRRWLPHSYEDIVRTSSPVVKRKIIAKLIGRAKCRSRAVVTHDVGNSPSGEWQYNLVAVQSVFKLVGRVLLFGCEGKIEVARHRCRSSAFG